MLNVLKKIFLLVVVIQMFGCSRDFSEVKLDAYNRISISFTDSGIVSAEDIKWKVGPGFKQTLSKGVAVKIKFPLLRKENIIELGKRGVDSWLVKVFKMGLNSNRILGYVYIPLRVSGTRVVTQRSHGFFNIYYAAASPSPRFENFICPAFNHQKKISSMKLRSRQVLSKKLTISRADINLVNSRVLRFGVRPVSFNGGKSLVGDYGVEVAAYNISRRSRMSSFVILPGEIEVRSEEDRPVIGCLGSRIPKKVDRQDRSRFKFGN